MRALKWAEFACEDTRAQVGDDPERFCPSWLPELEDALKRLNSKPQKSEDEILDIFRRNCVHYAGNYEVTPGQAIRIAQKLSAKKP